jgi:SNF2 family DNA or RNA helicase
MFKNHASKRFKMLKEKVPQFSRRWILTGTPAPNGLMDLWAQMYLVDRGKALGHNITTFRRSFCQQKGFTPYQYEVVPGLAEKIYERVAPLVIQRSVNDGGVDMPPLLKNRIMVELPEDAKKIYWKMERDFFAIVEGQGIESPNAATAGGRCRQIASGAIYPNFAGESVHLIHNAKIEALNELLETLDSQSRPALIFYEFKHEAARIEVAFPGTPNLSNTDDPEKLVTMFNEGKLPRLLAHPQSAGYGLNLQELCRDVIFFTPPWDLAGYAQGIARVWRQGQKSGVTVHHIVAADTLDESVMGVLSHKDGTQQELLTAVRTATVEDFDLA